MADEKKKPRRWYNPDIIEFAKGLYLRRLSKSEIARQVRDTFDVKTTDYTIARWAKDGEWAKELMEVSTKAITQFQEETSYDIAERTQKQIEAYQAATKKGLDALENEDLKVKRAKDAAEMIDIGVRGERQVVMGVVTILLVGQLIDVLESEIKDPQDRERVARKLREVAAQWADKGM